MRIALSQITWSLLCVALVLTMNACGHQSVSIASTDSLEPGAFKLGYLESSNRKAGGYAEQFIMHGRLESGGRLFLRLFITNMAGAKGRAELTGRISLPSGEVYRVSTKKSGGAWRFGPTEFDVQLGSNRVQIKNGEAVVELVGQNFETRFTVESELPAFRPAGESVQFGDGFYYQTTVLFPRGQIDGFLRPVASASDAEKEPVSTELSGVLFAEHRVGNMAIYDMSQRWLQVRDIGNEHTFVLSAFQRSKRLGGGVQAWMYVADDDGIRMYEPSISLDLKDFKRIGQGPYDVPTSLSFQGTKGGVGVVKSDRLSSHKSDLSSLSPLVRKLVSLVMNPWTYRHQARYLIRASSEEERVFDGDAVYSYMQLK